MPVRFFGLALIIALLLNIALFSVLPRQSRRHPGDHTEQRYVTLTLDAASHPSDSATPPTPEPRQAAPTVPATPPSDDHHKPAPEMPPEPAPQAPSPMSIEKSEPAVPAAPDARLTSEPHPDIAGSKSSDLQEVPDIGRVDSPPVVTHKVEPVYPAHAGRKNIQGLVMVSLYVSEEGRPYNATIEEAEPAGVFEAAVLEALKQWRFKPALKAGRPVVVRLSVPIRFELR